MRQHSYAHYGFWDKPPRARKFHWFPDPRLLYAQLRKSRRGRRIKFVYSIIRLGTRQAVRGALEALELSGLVQTSYVERSNLTLRELIAPLSRRTWSLAYRGVFTLKTPKEKSGGFLHIICGCTFNGVWLIIISAEIISRYESVSEGQVNIVIEHLPWLLA